MHKIFTFILFLTAVLLPLYSQQDGDDTNADGKPDRWVKIAGNKVDEIHLDRDYDGNVDYIVKYDDNSEKTEEVLDFNYDGTMDDYYFYAAGKMKYREIDTNYDGKIDIWVYLDGIYIMKYEKDTDFDGIIDIVKDYTED